MDFKISIPKAADEERRRDEASFALLNLAAARVLTIDANQATDEVIAQAVRLVHGE
jgi:hypothetical protein